MRQRVLVLTLVILVLGWLAPLPGQEMSLTGQVIEKVLPNGLKVLLVKRPQAPLVRCILAYRVGSVNERPGITGISHFHEHMMFKGTYSMGVKPGTLGRYGERPAGRPLDTPALPVLVLLLRHRKPHPILRHVAARQTYGHSGAHGPEGSGSLPARDGCGRT